MNQISENTPSQKSGCCLFSCMGCFGMGCIVTVLLSVGITYGGYFVARVFIPNLILQYTSTEPLATAPAIPEPVIAQVSQKMTRVTNESTSSSKPITEKFTSAEIPALLQLATHGTSKNFNGVMSIKNGMLLVNFGYPLNDLTKAFPATLFLVPELGSRNLVGQVGFSFSISNGRPQIEIAQLNLNNQMVPDLIIRQLNRFILQFIEKQTIRTSGDPENTGNSKNLPLQAISELRLSDDALHITVLPRTLLPTHPPTPNPIVTPSPTHP